MKKLIVFDIDGTLLNSQNRVSESTLRAIRGLRKMGHEVAIATGRSRFLIDEILAETGIDNYVICNGAGGFAGHEEVYRDIPDKARIVELVGRLNALGINVAAEGLDEMALTSSIGLSKVTDMMRSVNWSMPKVDKDFVAEHDIYQCLAFYPEGVDEKFQADFPDFRFVRWHEQCLDIIPRFGSKARSLKILGQKLGIAEQNIIAFGDGDNDVEMLKLAGVGIAMGNASQRAKNVANLITQSNDHNGIYLGLERLGFALS